MRNSLNSLAIDALIVHDIPKKFSQKYTRENPEEDAEDLILSDTPTVFDLELTRFFHDRITSTIGSSSAFEIVLDPTKFESKTQKALKEYFQLGEESSFPLPDAESIRITQEIAKSLHDVQTARNPGGMLLFIPCHNRTSNGIAILKVEREEGVRIQRTTNTSGQTTFDAQHIKDLMLTKKTKLFKIVLFFKSNNEIVGYLCDQQQGKFDNREVANFFLEDFLGCNLKEEPHVSTKKFFESTISFINNSDLTDDEKLSLHTHLISEITNNAASVNTQNFAQRCVPPAKLAMFMDALTKTNVPTTFSKDALLIADRIKKIQYELDCGIKIYGLESAIKENATFHQENNGKTKIEFIDHIKKVESK